MPNFYEIFVRTRPKFDAWTLVTQNPFSLFFAVTCSEIEGVLFSMSMSIVFIYLGTKSSTITIKSPIYTNTI